MMLPPGVKLGTSLTGVICICRITLFLVFVSVWIVVVHAQTNHNPTFTGGAIVTVAEDSSAYAVQWTTALSDNDGGGQSFTFTCTAANPSLFSTQPQVSGTGVLSFTPAPGVSGTTTVEVYAKDSGNTICVPSAVAPVLTCPCTPTDCSMSATTTMTIVITPVNDCPTFQLVGAQTVTEDSGQATVRGFAYQVSQGAADESGQTLTWTLTTNNDPLFSSLPAITWLSTDPTTGTLTFTPAANKWGTATVSVVAKDNGGTTGCDTSTTVFDACIVRQRWSVRLHSEGLVCQGVIHDGVVVHSFHG